MLWNGRVVSALFLAALVSRPQAATPTREKQGSLPLVNVDGWGRAYELREHDSFRSTSTEPNGNLVLPVSSSHQLIPLIAAPGEYYPSNASTTQECANDCDSIPVNTDGAHCFGFSFKASGESRHCVLHSICSMQAFGFQYVPFDVTRYCDQPITSCYCQLVYGDPGIPRRGRRFLRGSPCPGRWLDPFGVDA